MIPLSNNPDDEANRQFHVEKARLLGERWDQLAKHSGLAVTQAHREELDRRLLADAADAGRPWHDIRSDLLGRSV